MGQSEEIAGIDALFVYGTLVEKAFRERMLGRPIEAAAARLPGYQRGHSLHFYIVAREGAVTEGFILFGLTAQDFAMLDQYEEVPTLYTRERIEAIDETGHAIRCWVYLPTGWAQSRGGTET